MKNDIIITVTGPSGSGKSTVIELIRRTLQDAGHTAIEGDDGGQDARAHRMSVRRQDLVNQLKGRVSLFKLREDHSQSRKNTAANGQQNKPKEDTLRIIDARGQAIELRGNPAHVWALTDLLARKGIGGILPPPELPESIEHEAVYLTLCNGFGASVSHYFQAITPDGHVIASPKIEEAKGYTSEADARPMLEVLQRRGGNWIMEKHKVRLTPGQLMLRSILTTILNSAQGPKGGH